ncbi:MAG TPA: DUF4012 domain-containing protein [Patescibacteria group bacterium]|nr:DUF4012 domain-containing protein [Patescibacteria group bacterium]
MENIPKLGQTQNSPDLLVDKKSNVDNNSVLIPKIKMSESNLKKNFFKLTKTKKRVLIVLLSVVGVLIIILSITALLAFNAYKKALVLKKSLLSVKDAVSQQDIEKIKSEIALSKTSLNDFDKSYAKLSYLKIIPFIGAYFKDGKAVINSAKYGFDASSIVLAAIEPYADIIGFANGAKQASSGVETAQDRIDFVISTIPDLIPKMDELSIILAKIQTEIDTINPNRYPEEFEGIALRDNITNAIELTDTATKMIVNGKPLLAKSEYLLGVESPRTYLILFQNDKELRPTGGFITAYTIAEVSKGRFKPGSSSDIYDLDAKYTPVVAAPEQFSKYLKGIYVANRKFRLRDLNWSPDYSVSMDLFSQEVKKAGISKIDGIISVDTQVLVNLLDVLGEIGVSGFGNFSTKIEPVCNCPNVVYELEKFADTEGAIVWSENEPGKIVFAPPNYNDRKKIIGPLMNSVLSNTLGQPKDKMPMLFEAAIKSLTEKHVLFYFFDDDAQSAVDAFGIGGNISDYDGDYLHINDANLGGRKSNLYVTQEVSQEISYEGGKVVKRLEITYKNPEKQDGWLNSVLPNWTRIYVPKGSKLLEATGFEENLEPYEDLGKTVFAGYLQIRPLGVSKVTLKYELPLNSKDYKLFIQKQAGKDKPMYTVKVGKKTDEFLLSTDKELRYKL